MTVTNTITTPGWLGGGGLVRIPTNHVNEELEALEGECGAHWQRRGAPGCSLVQSGVHCVALRWHFVGLRAG